MNNSLSISSTQAGDNGTYTCVVSGQSNQQRVERSASLAFACKYNIMLCLGMKAQCTLNPHAMHTSVEIFMLCS